MGGRLGSCKCRDAQRSCGREEHANPPCLRKGFLERLKFLRYQLSKERRQPCGIAARPRETRDVSWVLNTIGTVLVAAKKTAVSAEEGANRTSTSARTSSA